MAKIVKKYCISCKRMTVWYVFAWVSGLTKKQCSECGREEG